MLHDILLTEYDLGVLRTSMEQERMDARRAPGGMTAACKAP